MSSINDIFVSSIRDVSSDGNGIAVHPSGRICFVPGVWPGDVGRFRVTDLKKSYGFARLEELLERSDVRIDPQCPHHGFGTDKCGNCPWQFVSYEEQLKAKSQNLLKNMERSGLDYKGKVKSIWKSSQTFGYRNRAQFKTDGQVLGYVVGRSHRIAPIKDCPILTDKNRLTLKKLRNTFPRKDFEPKTGQPWNTIDIDEDTEYDDLNLNKSRPFRQGNTAQNELIKKWLSERLSALNQNQPVLELFSGTGNFTEVISNLGFKKILAVDGHKDDLDQLKARDLLGVKTIKCNLIARKGFVKVAQAMQKPEVLVLDPPRAGLKNRNRVLWPIHKIN